MPGTDTTNARVRAAGDAAFLIELPPEISERTSGQVVAIGETVRRTITELRDVVVGYHTVTVYFDPFRVDGAALQRDLERIARSTATEAWSAGGHLEIPVCYGGELGPDLDAVAAMVGCASDEVVRLHSGTSYRVFVVGFVPGFAYMASLPRELASLGRRAMPRTRVPAGSVAIAGGQTGIYPIETPGGWHILGRTPVRSFDAARNPPGLFAPGDHVRFRPIERDEFARLAV